MLATDEDLLFRTYVAKASRIALATLVPGRASLHQNPNSKARCPTSYHTNTNHTILSGKFEEGQGCWHHGVNEVEQRQQEHLFRSLTTQDERANFSGFGKPFTWSSAIKKTGDTRMESSHKARTLQFPFCPPLKLIHSDHPPDYFFVLP